MTAEDNAGGFPCAQCGSHDIRRSHRKNSFETFKMAFGIYLPLSEVREPILRQHLAAFAKQARQMSALFAFECLAFRA